MITAKGAGFLAAAVAIYLLARLSQVGWLYLIDSVLWGMLFLSAAVPWLSVAFVRATRTAEPESDRQTIRPASKLASLSVEEEEPVRVKALLHNRTFFPRFFNFLSYESPLGPTESRLQRFFLAHLPGSAATALETTIEASRRGLHYLGPMTLESTAPFGIFRRRRTLSEATPILVLPKVYPLQRLSVVDGIGGRTTQPRLSRLGMDPVGSRPYVHGDSRRLIHWRNTARAGRPMVKESEEQSDQALHVLFDAIHVWGEDRDTTLEYGIKLAASVANYALVHQVSVTVWGGDLSGAALAHDHSWTGNAIDWNELLETLAMVQPGQGQPLAETLDRLPPGANVFLAASSADVDAFNALEQRMSGLGSLAAVRFQGFGEPTSNREPKESSVHNEIGLVTCQPGGLPETLGVIQGIDTGNPKANNVPSFMNLGEWKEGAA